MTKVYVGAEADQKLGQMGLTADELRVPLDQAVADARTCTDLDAPSAPAFIFWTRVNRYIREGLKPKSWGATNADQILRAIHPARAFSITAISGRGEVGNPRGIGRTKNPKGAAFARLIKVNSRLFGPPAPDPIPGLRLVGEEAAEKRRKELEEMPLWILLYRRIGAELNAELSLAADIESKTVEDWSERIMLEPVPYPGDPASLDIFGDDEDGQDGEGGLDIPVGWR